MSAKRVLVTGSSRGIGRAIARQLGQAGWKVAVHYGSVEHEALATAKLLGNAASGVYQADLSKPGDAEALYARARKDGPIHAIVNNAGVYMPLDFATASDAVFAANFHKTFAINFESPLKLVRLAVKDFAAIGGGKIVNVASRVGFKGEAGAAVYSATKAAMINLTRSLAVELAPKNIQLFAIAPGWVDTAMARDGMEDRLPAILEGIPMGRMATPEDCASTVRFLLSDEATYLSGVTIDINGASYFH